MAAIANLAVSVTARVGKFVKGMRRAGKRLRKFSRGVAASAKRVAKFGFALGAIATGGLVLLTRKAFAAGDSLAKVADKLGIATEKLAGLRLAAKLGGVETRTLDMALQRMLRRVSEAALGTGEAQQAIKDLGLEAKALNSLTPDKMLGRFADALAGVANQNDRIRLAFKIWDSEGVAMVNVVNGGSQALEEFQKQAVRFGTAIDRKAAAKIELANNAIELLKEKVAGLGRTIAIVAAPLVIALANDMQTLGGTAKSMGNKIAEGVKWAVVALGGMFDTLAQLELGWIRFRVTGQRALLAIVKSVDSAVRTSAVILSAVGNALLDKFIDTSRLPLIFKGAAAAMRVGLNQFVDQVDAAIKAMDIPSVAGSIAAFEEEIAAGADKAFEALKKLTLEPPSKALLNWFDALMVKVDELAAKIAGAATEQRGIPALAGAGGRGPKAGLRSLSQLGGTAGARAVSRAETNQAKELAELKKLNTTLTAIKQKSAGGMKP